METNTLTAGVGSRAEKMMLERQLVRCDSVLTTCLGTLPPDQAIDEWPYKRMLGLMKMSAQLAGTIARIEPQGRSKNREK